MTEERKALTVDRKRMGLKVADHALSRVARLTAAALIALLLRIIVLLFVARRACVARPEPSIQRKPRKTPTTMRPCLSTLVIALYGLPFVGLSQAPEGTPKPEADLAQQLANPVASLISVPLQSNLDFGLGTSDAMRYTLNVQPVIPFSLNEGWNLITRTILPLINAESPAPGIESAFGLGDTVQSFFLSRQEPVGGWILGAGPVVLWPTATDSQLGTGKWGAGPTGVALQQTGPWTYGALANHLWSYAGDDSRGEVNATFLQPFVAYTLPTQTTFTLNSESTYDWGSKEWTVASHFGGTRNGLAISWPKRINAKGEIPSQFHHVIDIMPTVLEAAGLPQPVSVYGIQQAPVEGVSMLYAFDDAKAPSKRTTQHSEMFANRAIYNDGWVATTTPTTPPWVSQADPTDPIDGYQWDLYDIKEDFSQASPSWYGCHDVDHCPHPTAHPSTIIGPIPQNRSTSTRLMPPL